MFVCLQSKHFSKTLGLRCDSEGVLTTTIANENDNSQWFHIQFDEFSTTSVEQGIYWEEVGDTVYRQVGTQQLGTLVPYNNKALILTCESYRDQPITDALSEHLPTDLINITQHYLEEKEFASYMINTLIFKQKAHVRDTRRIMCRRYKEIGQPLYPMSMRLVLPHSGLIPFGFKAGKVRWNPYQGRKYTDWEIVEIPNQRLLSGDNKIVSTQQKKRKRI